MYINVDRSQFERAAQAVDRYVSSSNKQMFAAKEQVDSLKGGWKGLDEEAFDQKWQSVTSKDSTHTKMMNSLTTYSKVLRYAAEQYKEAQAKAYDQSRSLRS